MQLPLTMPSVLDNIVWNALAGPQAIYATGAGGARRYAPGFSPIVGFADAQHPQLDALLPYCAAGEHFYCSGWSGQAPPQHGDPFTQQGQRPAAGRNPGAHALGAGIPDLPDR